MNKINCFLACFDVLGFKALRKTKNTDGLYQLYKRHLLPSMQHAAAEKGKTTEEGFVPDFNSNSINFRIFSDTVILFTKYDSFDSFFYIINSAHQLLTMGFVGSRTPFRGAIGYGDLIVDNNGIIVGEALEDAYKWESKQAWAGCLITDACENFITEKKYLTQLDQVYESALTSNPSKTKDIKLNSKRITEYDVPLYKNPKQGCIKYYKERKLVLDWTVRMYENASDKSFLPYGNNEHAKFIADNTKDFESWARKKNR